ncbi:MAG: hypothetical protein QMC77_01120 [Methanocellales archaeon]|nr:hypothetical protein [Methanocellales archaeon]
MGLDKIYMLRPSVREGDRFIRSREGEILNDFLHQQEEWLQENDVKLIQLQAPIALKRTAKLLGEEIDLDLTLYDVLKRREYANTLEGVPYKDDLSDMYGAIFASKTRIVDAIMFSNKGVVMTEIKTDLTKGGNYDTAIGQLTIYREAFVEDFPSIAQKGSIDVLLLTEGCEELELAEDTLKRLQISLYDTEAEEFLISEPFSSIGDFVQRLKHMAEIVGKPEFELRNYDVALAIAMQGTDESLAEARLILESIDPFKPLDPEDFKKFYKIVNNKSGKD